MSISVNTSSAHYDYCAMQVLNSVNKSLGSLQEGQAMSEVDAEKYVNSSEHKTFISRQGEFPEFKVLVYRRALDHLIHHDIQSRINSLTFDEREVYTKLLDRSIALSRENESYFPTRKVLQRIAKIADKEIPRHLPPEKEDALVRNSLLIQSIVYDYFKEHDYYFFEGREIRGDNDHLTSVRIRILPEIYCRINQYLKNALLQVTTDRTKLTCDELRIFNVQDNRFLSVLSSFDTVMGDERHSLYDRRSILSLVPRDLDEQKSQLTAAEMDEYVTLFQDYVCWETINHRAGFMFTNQARQISLLENPEFLKGVEIGEDTDREVYLKNFYLSPVMNSIILDFMKKDQVQSQKQMNLDNRKEDGCKLTSLYPEPTGFSNKLSRSKVDGHEETLFFDELDRKNNLRLRKVLVPGRKKDKQLFEQWDSRTEMWCKIDSKKYKKLRGDHSACVVL